MKKAKFCGFFIILLLFLSILPLQNILCIIEAPHDSENIYAKKQGSIKGSKPTFGHTTFKQKIIFSKTFQKIVENEELRLPSELIFEYSNDSEYSEDATAESVLAPRNTIINKSNAISAIIIERNNQSDELSVRKKSGDVIRPLSPGPDLIIEDIWWEDAYGNTVTEVTSGQPFRVWFRVKNIGSSTAYNIRAEVYFGKWCAYADIDSLGPGSSIDFYSPYISLSTIGYHEFRAVADVYNSVVEDNEGNNERTEYLYIRKAKWTVLAYLDGDNNLESYVIDDFEDLADVGSTVDVTIVVQMDRISGYSTEYGDWTDCLRFFVTNNLDPIEENQLDVYAEDAYYDGDLGEVNMGSGSVLENFLVWGVNHFKADYYLIILENHGASWAGVCWDDTDKDRIDLNELESALDGVYNAIGRKIDVVFFDACLMGSVEVIASIYQYVDYAVVSETVGWTNSFPYEKFLGEGIIEHLKNNPSIDPQTFVYDAVDLSNPVDDSTSVTQCIAAYDLHSSYASWLVNDIEWLSYYLIEYYADYKSSIGTARSVCDEMEGPVGGCYCIIDLYQFANALETYVSQSDIQYYASWIKIDIDNLVINCRTTSSASFCHGVSIYFPESYSDYTVLNGAYHYNQTSFAQKTQWDEFFEDVYFDTSPPFDLSITINDGATYTNSREVTLTLSASDTGYGVKDMCFSNDGSSWSAWEPYSTTKTWTLPSGDGTKYVYLRVRDYAGNIAGPVYDTIILDTTPPSTSHTVSGTEQSGWYKDSVTVSISASDSTSGVYRIYYRYYKKGTSPPSWSYISGSSGSFTVNPTGGTGTYIVEYYAVDNAGNSESIHSFEVNIDNSPPSSEHSISGTMGDNGWYVSGVSMTISASDSGIGVYYIKYRIDGGEWQICYDTSVTFTLTNDGEHIVEYYAVDKLGHQENYHTVTIKIDKTPPSSSHTVSGDQYDSWYKDSASVTIDASDATSGIYRIYYRYYKQGTTPPSWVYHEGTSVTFTVDPSQGPGTYIIEYYAVDNAGNQDSTHSVIIQIDNTYPSSSHSVSGTLGQNGWYVSDVDITVTATDTGSGVDYIAYRIDGGEWQYYYGGELILSIGMEGNHTVDYYVVDVMGHRSAIVTVAIGIDKTPPLECSFTVEGELGYGGWYVSYVYVSIFTSDEVSGLEKIMYKINEGEWMLYRGTILLNQSGIYTISAYGVDLAGNNGPIATITVKVDVDSPLIDILSPENGTASATTNISVSWTAVDMGSGIRCVMLYLNNTLVYNTTNASGTYVLSVSDNGLYYLRAIACDNAGHNSSKIVVFLVDIEPPLIQITYPTMNSVFNTTTIVLRWLAEDELSGIEHIEVYINDSLEITLDGAARNATLHLSEGCFNITLVAIDKAGNNASDSIFITVDTTSPIVESVDCPTRVKIGEIVTISATVIDPGVSSGIYEVVLYYSEDGNVWLHLPMIYEEGKYTAELQINSNRVYIRIKAVDNAGNTGWSRTITIHGTGEIPPISNIISIAAIIILALIILAYLFIQRRKRT